MKFRPGPHQVFDSDLPRLAEGATGSPPRYYGCCNYSTCLNVAAALNWDNFSCCGCSAEVDQALFWQARQAQKKDAVAKRLCSIPQAELMDGRAKHVDRTEAELKSIISLKQRYLSY